MAQGYWQSTLSHGFTSPYPSHGLLTYFLPMQAGSRKGWSSQKSDFFCCHGTLVQANAAFNRGLYYQSEDTLYVCQYRDSQVTFSIKDTPVTLLQKQDPLTGSSHLASTSSEKQSVLEDTRKYPSQPDCLVPCLKIETAKAVEMTLQIRIPWWIAGEAQILVNGEEIWRGSDAVSFVPLNRTWKDGDVVRILLPKAVKACPLPDDETMTAFLYGPVVLAGLTDEERTLHVPDLSRPEQILVHDNEREWGSWKSTFRTTGQERGIRFIPLHDVGYEPYSIYFPVKSDR